MRSDELRAIIEGRATADVAGKATDEQLAELEGLIEQMRAVVPSRDVDGGARTGRRNLDQGASSQDDVPGQIH